MRGARAAAIAAALSIAPCAAGCASLPTFGRGAVAPGSASDVPALVGYDPSGSYGHTAPESFWSSFSAPLWVVLILNFASLVAAGTGAWAALRTNPKTARDVANQQADVARSAVAASAASADAAREAAAASTLNARTAETVAANQGVHAIARLRQEWIDELRSRVAEAHGLLANPSSKLPMLASAPAQAQADLEYRRRANEAVTKIELMLNPDEEASRALMTALDAMNQPDLNLVERQARGLDVRAAAQAILKAEWDRVRGELRAAPVATA